MTTKLATNMTDAELVAALLTIASNEDQRALTATERYGVIYEAATRLRKAAAA